MAKTKGEALRSVKKKRPAKDGLAPAGGIKTPKKKRLSDGGVAGIKKPHRFKSGTRALMEIRKWQRVGKWATAELLPSEPFYRVVKETMAEQNGDMRLKRSAFRAIKQATEERLVKQMQTANLAAIHAGRQGITPDDIRVANLIRAMDRGTPFETAQPLSAKFKAAQERAQRKQEREARVPKKAAPAKAKTPPPGDASAVDETSLEAGQTV